MRTFPVLLFFALSNLAADFFSTSHDDSSEEYKSQNLDAGKAPQI